MSDPVQTRPDMVGRGIILTLATVVIFCVQDAVSKMLVQQHSPFFITMLRYWGFALFSIVLVARQAPLRQAFVSKAPMLQITRGALLIIEIWCFALALQTVPLAELQAIVIVYPLIVTIAAIPLLGEKVGIVRFAAVGIGFLGALVIMRPGGLPLSWGVLFGLGSATLYAIYIVITRKVSRLDSAATSVVYTAVVGLVLSTGVGLFFMEPLTWGEFGLIAFITLTTCSGHAIMIYALSLAPASVLQPFNYFTVPVAIVLSVIFFGHWIDPISLLGAAIIVGAGLFVMARERRLAGRSR